MPGVGYGGAVLMRATPKRGSGRGTCFSRITCVYSRGIRVVKHGRGFSRGPASMRILLVADIHANWPALQAVASEPYDVCLCLGDLVDYGLEPGPCIAWARAKAHYAVRGNHDHGAAQNVIVNGRTGLKYLTGVTRVLTRQR